MEETSNKFGSRVFLKASISDIGFREPFWIGKFALTCKALRVRDVRESKHSLNLRFPLKVGLRGYGNMFLSENLSLQVFSLIVGAPFCFEDTMTADFGDAHAQSSQKSVISTDHKRRIRGVGLAACLLVFLQVLFPDSSRTAISLLTPISLTDIISGSFLTLGVRIFRSIPFLGRLLPTPQALNFHRTKKGKFGVVSRVYRNVLYKADQLSIAAAILSYSGKFLRSKHPEIAHTFSCLGASLPVLLRHLYIRLKVKSSGTEWEVAREWRNLHRWTAVRVCRMLTTLQEPCQLAPVARFITSLSVRPVYGELRGLHTKTAGSASTGILVSFQVPHQEITTETQVVRTERQMVPLVTAADNQAEVLSSNPGGSQTALEEASETLLFVLRSLFLLSMFLPLFLAISLLLLLSRKAESATWRQQLRNSAWYLLRTFLERAGPAFIKWGQWSSTRDDLFPRDLCDSLASLQDRAPVHSYALSVRQIERSFGQKLDRIFAAFDRVPIASGSIAQVHRATLRDPRQGEPAEVAVKVCHPNVAVRLTHDFTLMRAVASWLDWSGAVKWISASQTVDHFCETMGNQADMRCEAANLLQFRRNFQDSSVAAVFPELVPRLVSEWVLVESFEQGQPLHRFLRSRTNLNSKIASIGVETYLKMILVDNFVHTDLHPGNILARIDQSEGGAERVQLIVLDFGLAETLSKSIRFHFLSFILMVCKGDASQATRHLLHFSNDSPQMCPTPNELASEMKTLFERECRNDIRAVDLNLVLKSVLRLCHIHQVTVHSAYTSLLISVCVIVGFAQSLDPDLSILDATTSCLFMYNLSGQIFGRLYG